jgi:nucleoside-diphosphate-sugar epimerase
MPTSIGSPDLACVTGATGGLGRVLVGRLMAESMGVVGVGLHEPEDGVVPFRRFVVQDVSSASWPRVIDGSRVVFHLAAFVHRAPRTAEDQRRVFEINHEATIRLAASCRESGATLVFASTVAVFGPPDGRRRRDEDDVAPATPYARSKWLAEQAIREEGGRGLRFVILRFPLLYGPHGRGNMERMVRAMVRGRYWPVGRPTVRKSCLFLGDAAEALLRAWRSPATAGGTFIVAPDETPTLHQIHEAAYGALGRDVPRPILPRPLALGAARLIDLAAHAAGRRTRLAEQVRTLTESTDYDGSRFAAAAGFRPRTDLRSGLRETVRWVQGTSLPPGGPLNRPAGNKPV